VKRQTLSTAVLSIVLISAMSSAGSIAEAQAVNTFQPTTTTGAWEDNNNWSQGHVPTAAEKAVIPTGKVAEFTTAEVKKVASLEVQTGAGAFGPDVEVEATGKIDVAGQIDGQTTLTGKEGVTVSGVVRGQKGGIAGAGGDITIKSDKEVVVTGDVVGGEGGNWGGRGGNIKIDSPTVTVENSGYIYGGIGGSNDEGKGGKGGSVDINAETADLTTAMRVEGGCGGNGTDGGDGGDANVITPKVGGTINGKTKIETGGRGSPNDPSSGVPGQRGKLNLEGEKISLLPPNGGLDGSRISVTAYALADLSYLYEGAINSPDSITIRTGAGGIINLGGIPTGVNVLTAINSIHLITDNVLLDPGVLIADITEPDAIITSPGGVGGIAELPEITGPEAATSEAAGTNYTLWMGIAVAGAVGAVVLGTGLWYSRRRWIR